MPPVVRRLDSLADLRRNAPAWNELWTRSDSTRPTARAEHLALWHGCFSRHRPFVALVVEDDGQAVAALPLVGGRWWGLPARLSLGNAWSPAGELLLDPACDATRVCESLLEGLRAFASGLVVLDGLVLDAPAVRAILTHLDDSRTSHVMRRRFWVPRVEIAGDWAAYFASRSYNHRRHMRAICRRAERLGNIRLERHETVLPDEVDRLLHTSFEIEAAGWKGRARSRGAQRPCRLAILPAAGTRTGQRR